MQGSVYFSYQGVEIKVHEYYNTISNQKAFVLKVDIIKLNKLNEEKHNTKSR